MYRLLCLAALAAATTETYESIVRKCAARYPSPAVREMEETLLKDLQNEKDGQHGHVYHQKALYETIETSNVGWTLYAAMKGTVSVKGEPPKKMCILSVDLPASETFSMEGMYKTDNVDALKRPFVGFLVAAASAGLNNRCDGPLPDDLKTYGRRAQAVSYFSTTHGSHSGSHSNLFGSVQGEVVAVSKSGPRQILFAHREGLTGFSPLFDYYKQNGGSESALLSYLEREAQPVSRERCVEVFYDGADAFQDGLTAEQRAQEDAAAEREMEMKGLTRVGIENGGPFPGMTYVLESGYRPSGPGLCNLNGAGEFAGRDDIVSYYDQDDVVRYGNPARMDELRRMLRKELRPNMGQDRECIAELENALDKLGDKTVDELEIYFRKLGADVIRMDSPDAEQRLNDALGTDETADLEEERYVMILSDNFGRHPDRPRNRLAQFV